MVALRPVIFRLSPQGSQRPVSEAGVVGRPESRPVRPFLLIPVRISYPFSSVVQPGPALRRHIRPEPLTRPRRSLVPMAAACRAREPGAPSPTPRPPWTTGTPDGIPGLGWRTKTTKPFAPRVGRPVGKVCPARLPGLGRSATLLPAGTPGRSSVSLGGKDVAGRWGRNKAGIKAGPGSSPPGGGGRRVGRRRTPPKGQGDGAPRMYPPSFMWPGKAWNWAEASRTAAACLSQQHAGPCSSLLRLVGLLHSW